MEKMIDKIPKTKEYKENKGLVYGGKGYKPDNTNRPDPKKVKEYFSKKK